MRGTAGGQSVPDSTARVQQRRGLTRPPSPETSSRFPRREPRNRVHLGAGRGRGCVPPARGRQLADFAFVLGLGLRYLLDVLAPDLAIPVLPTRTMWTRISPGLPS